jgi:hypothetical protein
LARREPQLADLALFLSQAYNLKAVADYELGPGAGVPLDRASEAIGRAAQFIEQIATRSRLLRSFGRDGRRT